MNRRLILAAALLALSAPLALHAQEPTPPPAAAAARTPDQVASMYAKRLSLTPDQTTKIKPIIADRQQQMIALRGDSTLKPREKVQKMKALSDDTDKRLKVILTGDQFTKYKAMEAEQREKLQERRQAAGNN